MKFSSQDAQFQPVTVTLETRAEVGLMARVLGQLTPHLYQQFDIESLSPIWLKLRETYGMEEYPDLPQITLELNE